MLTRVLVATGEAPIRRRLLRLLDEELDALADAVRSTDGVWKHVSREVCDIVIISQALMPKPAAETIRALRELPDGPEVVVLTGTELSPEERAELLGAGTAAVLSSDLPDKTLGEVIGAILERQREAAEEKVMARRLLASPSLKDFVSSSPTMQTFMALVRRVVSSDATLLILGETGVGKEWLARAIHAEGARARGPFVAVNCSAVPEALLESELFGHEKGAFTGASQSRRGWFELAHGGTVFLDEIADMSPHLQVKLLRFLQEHEIVRVGGEKAIHVDVRVMAATNREIAEEVASGSFRRDLYYRLGVVSLAIPPLRERREDIPDLVQSYIGYFRRRMGRAVTDISGEALLALADYDWPGNVRELINVIERAMLLCEGKEILVEDLPGNIGLVPAGPYLTGSEMPGVGEDRNVPAEWLRMSWNEVREIVVGDVEKRYLASLLQETAGRIGETAKRAGIQPRSLYEKMRQHGLRKEDFK